MQLTHIGEELIARMFNQSAAVRSAVGTSLGIKVDKYRSVTEAPLHSYGELRFDGGSRVDVALLNDDEVCIACEAKLGTSLMAKRSFEDRFLKPCTTSHSETRVAGSMPAILERKFETPVASPLVARVDETNYTVTKPWGLIVRREIAKRWGARGQPALSDQCTIMVFEELVDAFGGASSFNELVKEIVSFDYFTTWLE